MADTLSSGGSEATRVGSNPIVRTRKYTTEPFVVRFIFDLIKVYICDRVKISCKVSKKSSLLSY